MVVGYQPFRKHPQTPPTLTRAHLEAGDWEDRGVGRSSWKTTVVTWWLDDKPPGWSTSLPQKRVGWNFIFDELLRQNFIIVYLLCFALMKKRAKPRNWMCVDSMCSFTKKVLIILCSACRCADSISLGRKATCTMLRIKRPWPLPMILRAHVYIKQCMT